MAPGSDRAAGPYSTPLLRSGVLYAVGVTGKFHAFDASSGEILWAHDLDDMFDMSGYSGFAPSPLAYGGNVILPVGGRGQAVVAFDLESGAVAWKNQDFRLAPASPLLIDVDGEEQLVVFTPDDVVGLDPDDGALLWSYPHATNYGLNISTPVWGEGNLLFSSSAYNGGSRVIRLTREGGKTTAEELWSTNRLRLHFGSARVSSARGTARARACSLIERSASRYTLVVYGDSCPSHKAMTVRSEFGIATPSRQPGPRTRVSTGPKRSRP